MKTLTAICVVIVLSSLLMPPAGSARKVDSWPYDRLFMEADLVVIASAQATSPFKEKWPEELFDKDRFEGVSTVFGASSSALKGDAPPRINVVHFKYREGAQPYNDGPGLVSFFREPLLVEVREQSKKNEEGTLEELAPVSKRRRLVSQPEYLLFLEKREDDLYEPVSGQLDAAFSVRALFHPGSLR